MILAQDYYAPEDFMIGLTVDILRCFIEVNDRLEFDSNHGFKIF